MLVKEELKKIFHELITGSESQVFLNDYDITVQTFDNSTKLVLTTPVYFGGSYIPKSVRTGITKTPPFERNQTIKTTLNVDEENFRVFLQFLGTTDTFNNSKFVQVIEDFYYLSEEWRIYLDEHDKNDLIYVHV